VPVSLAVFYCILYHLCIITASTSVQRNPLHYMKLLTCDCKILPHKTRHIPLSYSVKRISIYGTIYAWIMRVIDGHSDCKCHTYTCCLAKTINICKKLPNETRALYAIWQETDQAYFTAPWVHTRRNNARRLYIKSIRYSWRIALTCQLHTSQRAGKIL